jgi:heterodisulfide reductase subunit B
LRETQEQNPVGNKYLIFLGCAIPYRVSSYEISARKVLTGLGVELVEMPEFNCCGLPLDAVSHETMLILAAKNCHSRKASLNILTYAPIAGTARKLTKSKKKTKPNETKSTAT